MLVASSAYAEVCPNPEVRGPDASLVAEVTRALESSLSTSTSTQGCRRIVVDAEPVAEGVRVTLTDGDARRSRIVGSAETAASLIGSWTAPALDGLSWLDTSTASTVSTDTSTAATPAPAATPRATADPVPDAPPPAPEARPAAPAVEARSTPPSSTTSTWWAAVGGATSGAPATGFGVELGWRADVGPVQLGPTLRAQRHTQPGREDVAGARTYEAAGGAQVSFTWPADAPVDVRPHLGVRLAYRRVVPTDAVGVIACQPPDPCELGGFVPPDAPPFDTLTVWTELGATGTWHLGEQLGLNLGGAVSVTPGFLSWGAPEPVLPEPQRRTRSRPLDPRWRLLAQVGLQWEVQ